MKIPTLLGMTIIVTLIALTGLYFYYSPSEKTENNSQISDLKVVNLSDTSATIVWQTTTPTIGKVSYSLSEDLSQSASDNRDRGTDKARMVHFVTINNLKSDSKYFYKVKNDDSAYPDKALGFRTARASEESDDPLTFSFIRPLKGTILNTNLNPIDESLIFLQIPGAQEMATFSSTAGNFILPLKKVYNKELDKIFMIPSNTKADLTVVKGVLKSDIKISISDLSVNLPPITIGSSLDLEKFTPSQIKKITFSETAFQGLDFNKDGRINSLDLAMLKEAATLPGAANTQTQSRFDINTDGVIDQKDIDAFSKSLSGE